MAATIDIKMVANKVTEWDPEGFIMCNFRKQLIKHFQYCLPLD